jgi:Meiosis protein SPO22/ZIP4 like
MFGQIEIKKLISDHTAVEELSDILYEIGRDEYSKKRPDIAIRWLEWTLNILDDQNLEYLTDTAPDLKLSTLHLLIKCFLAVRSPESLLRAQSIMELMDAEFGDKMIVSLLKLELLSANSKPDPDVYHGVLLRLFRSIHLSRSNFKTIMHHLHKLRNIDPNEACKAIDEFLTIRLFEQDKEEFIERAAVMRIWITTTTSTSTNMLTSLEELLGLISKNSKGPFSSAATHASQTLLWKVIEAEISQKRYDLAEKLCRMANHPTFSKCGEGSKAKLARKVMICALARHDLIAAREAFFSMPQAAQLHPQSRFLLYKVALRSQDDDLGSLCH